MFNLLVKYREKVEFLLLFSRWCFNKVVCSAVDGQFVFMGMFLRA